MRLSIVIAQGGKHTGRRIAVRKFPFLIGRDACCQLRLTHLAISKKHCALTDGDHGMIVQDLRSTNGTYVNGRLLRGGDLQLGDGDVITVGPLAFTVHIREVPAAAPGEEPTAESPMAEEAADGADEELPEAPITVDTAAVAEETQEQAAIPPPDPAPARKARKPTRAR